jgi:hypothetical protein
MRTARTLGFLSLPLVLALAACAAGCGSSSGGSATEDGGADATQDATEDSGEPGDSAAAPDQTTGDAGGDASADASEDRSNVPEASVGDAAHEASSPDASTNDAQTPDSGLVDSSTLDSGAATAVDSATADSSTSDGAAPDASPEAGPDASLDAGATQNVLLLGVTSAGALTADLFDGSSWAAPATVSGTATGDDLSLATIPGTGQGVGLLHGASDQLVYTLWNGAAWSPLAQINADTTQGKPSLAASGSTAYAVYWGSNYKYYLEQYSAGAWTSSSQAVFPAGSPSQPCGPSPGALAPLGAAASFVFVNGSCSGALNHLYDSDLSAGAWKASTDVASNPSYSGSQGPAVVAPSSGPELVTVFLAQGTSQLQWASRTGGVWSSPVSIDSALTSAPVALAPLAGGSVLLAFQGTDGKLYTATFASGTWSSPAPAFATNVSVATTPAVAAGIGGALAEMVYLDATGALFHTRLAGTTWSSPVPVAPATTGFAHVAIASGP